MSQCSRISSEVRCRPAWPPRPGSGLTARARGRAGAEPREQRGRVGDRDVLRQRIGGVPVRPSARSARPCALHAAHICAHTRARAPRQVCVPGSRVPWSGLPRGARRCANAAPELTRRARSALSPMLTGAGAASALPPRPSRTCRPTARTAAMWVSCDAVKARVHPASAAPSFAVPWPPLRGAARRSAACTSRGRVTPPRGR